MATAKQTKQTKNGTLVVFQLTRLACYTASLSTDANLTYIWYIMYVTGGGGGALSACGMSHDSKLPLSFCHSLPHGAVRGQDGNVFSRFRSRSRSLTRPLAMPPFPSLWTELLLRFFTSTKCLSNGGLWLQVRRYILGRLWTSRLNGSAVFFSSGAEADVL